MNKILNYDERKLHGFDDKKHQQLIDFLIILGGDGSLLHGVNFFKDRTAPPVLAFGKGTLNFMCNQNIHKFDEILEHFLQDLDKQNMLRIQNRMRLRAVMNKANTQEKIKITGLNEIMIDRGNNPLPLGIDIFIDDLHFTSVVSDGLIISTPNGSTAYALSAGGSILSNEIEAIQIVPICPHQFSFRPIILPATVKLRIQLSKSKPFNQGFMSCDGRNQVTFCKGDFIELYKSPHDVPFIKSYDDNFSTLKHWCLQVYRIFNQNSHSKQHNSNSYNNQSNNYE